jgi:ESX-1-secreted protein regulator
MGQTPARSPRTLQDKIDHLFRSVRPPGQKREYTLPEVCKALAEAGYGTSTSYLHSLRRGERDNPTKSVLEGLAQFFGVSPLYFFDDEHAAVVEQELELLSALRDGAVRAIALRAAGLGDADRELLRRIALTMGEPSDGTSGRDDEGKAKARRAPASGKASVNGSGPASTSSPRRRPGRTAAIRPTSGKPRP